LLRRLETSDTTASDPIGRGQPYPFGADPRPDGVGFSVYSADATGIDLLLFDVVTSSR
jgi:pullulanase/glycogen debranching enzyme